MNLYAHDCSYMRTEYAREQSIKSYDIEARQKEKALDDGEQDGNEYQFPVIGSGHQKPVEEAV